MTHHAPARFDIVARQDFSDVTYLLEIAHPMMARVAQPGQFVMVMLHEHGERQTELVTLRNGLKDKEACERKGWHVRIYIVTIRAPAGKVRGSSLEAPADQLVGVLDDDRGAGDGGMCPDRGLRDPIAAYLFILLRVRPRDDQVAVGG